MSDGVRALAALKKQWSPIFELIPDLEEVGDVAALVARKKRALKDLEDRIIDRSAAMTALQEASASLQREIEATRGACNEFNSEQRKAAQEITKQAQDEAVRIKAQAEGEAHDIKARAAAKAKEIADEGRRAKQALDEEVNETQRHLIMVEDKLAEAQKRLDDVRSALDSIRKGA
jgi:chromosome segregation ATPase